MATELILGFPEGFVNQELLDRQQQLWTDALDGFFSLPINLPGFGAHFFPLLCALLRYA